MSTGPSGFVGDYLAANVAWGSNQVSGSIARFSLSYIRKAPRGLHVHVGRTECSFPFPSLIGDRRPGGPVFPLVRQEATPREPRAPCIPCALETAVPAGLPIPGTRKCHPLGPRVPCFPCALGTAVPAGLFSAAGRSVLAAALSFTSSTRRPPRVCQENAGAIEIETHDQRLNALERRKVADQGGTNLHPGERQSLERRQIPQVRAFRSNSAGRGAEGDRFTLVATINGEILTVDRKNRVVGIEFA